MLHSGIKFGYAVLIIASSVMAFAVVHSFDEASVAGPSFAMSFTKTKNGASGSRVADMLEAFTGGHRTNVGRLYADPRNDRHRRIYLAVGDPRAESTGWLAQGYPFFSRGADLELRPYREIVNIHPDGLYYVYGSEQVANELLGAFASLGYHGQIEPVGPPLTALTFYEKGAISRFAVLLGFALVLTVSAAVVLNAKSYGIQRLQGRPLAQILWNDARQLAPVCIVTFALVSVMSVGLLYLYNGLNQFASFASAALVLIGIYLFVAALTHGLTLALVHRDTILNAVRGEVTADWAVAGSLVLRMVAIALFFSIGTSVIVSGLALHEHRQKSRTWAAMGAAHYLRLGGGAQDEQTGRAVDAAIGGWLREADARDEVALAWQLGPESGMTGPDAPDVLVVNDRYLLDHAIHDSTGARMSPADDDAVRVLVPRRHAPDLDAIRAGVAQWVGFQSERAGNVTPPDLHLEQTGDGQVVPSFARPSSKGAVTLDDPIIAVVTGTSRVIPDDEYTSAASRGELLFDDPDGAMESLRRAGADTYVLGMSPFAQEAADQYREAQRAFAVQVLNLLLATSMLLLTALALAIVYCRRNAQALFVKYLSGWGWLRMNRLVLAGEGAIVTLLVLWTWHSTTTRVNAYTISGAPPPPQAALPLGGWEPVAAGAVGLMSLALLALVLRRTISTFARTHSASLS